MKIERRDSGLLELRADGAAPGRVVMDVMRYEKIDTYGTRFAPGTFTESLSARMPVMLWVHSLSDPVGRWVDADDTAKRLRLAGQLDLEMINETMPAVPSAHRAFAQLRSGTVREGSVGFVRQEDEEDGQRITKADLPETSLTPVGSVPGTQLVSVRTPSEVRSDLLDLGTDLWARVKAGEISRSDAVAVLTLVRGTEALAGPDEEPPSEPSEEDLAAQAEAAAYLDAS